MTGPPEVLRLSAVEVADLVGPAPTVDDLDAAMTMVRNDRDAVVDLLVTSLDAPQLAEVTARSYRHPNGFAKLVLHDPGPDGTSVRLHVWPTVGTYALFDEVPRHDTAPHQHRWSFASAVVAGSGLFVEDFARVEDGGDEYEEYLFAPEVTPDLERTGDARLSSRDYWVRERDADVYWCDPDVIHTVAPIDNGMTATLVLQGPEVRPSALVFRRPDAPPDLGRAPLDEEMVAGLIKEVLVAVETSTLLPAGSENTRSVSA